MLTNMAYYGRGLQLWGGTGAPIGDMTWAGGNAAAFNSNTDQSSAAGAASPTSVGAFYVGKDWGAGNDQIMGAARVYATNDVGFGSVGGNYTFKLQGSSNGSSWTDLSAIATVSNASGAYVDIQATAQTTAYRYHRVLGAPPSSAYAALAQVRFYTPDVNGDYGAFAAPPFVFTAPANGDYYIELQAGGGGGGSPNAGNAAGGGGGGGFASHLVTLTAGETLTIDLPRGGLAGAVGADGGSGGAVTVVSNLSGSVPVIAYGGAGGFISGASGPGGVGNGNRLQLFGAPGGSAAQSLLVCGGPGGAGYRSGGAQGGNDFGEVGVGAGAGGGGGYDGRVGGDGGPSACWIWY